mmetsp:Transcript_3138/g.4634  ORF Transcript_3138/g.4634 Transcript_3138/m.4634 type:complete len:192 (+) Transcript_3138:1060-1635(+)
MTYEIIRKRQRSYFNTIVKEEKEDHFLDHKIESFSSPSSTFTSSLKEEPGYKKWTIEREHDIPFSWNIPCLDQSTKSFTTIHRLRKSQEMLHTNQSNAKRLCPSIDDDFMNQLNWNALVPLTRHIDQWFSHLFSSENDVPASIYRKLRDSFLAHWSPSMLYRQIPPSYHHLILKMYSEALLFGFSNSGGEH